MKFAKLTRVVLGIGAIVSAPALAADPATIDWRTRSAWPTTATCSSIA